MSSSMSGSPSPATLWVGPVSFFRRKTAPMSIPDMAFSPFFVGPLTLFVGCLTVFGIPLTVFMAPFSIFGSPFAIFTGPFPYFRGTFSIFCGVGPRNGAGERPHGLTFQLSCKHKIDSNIGRIYDFRIPLEKQFKMQKHNKIRESAVFIVRGNPEIREKNRFFLVFAGLSRRGGIKKTNFFSDAKR